MNGNALKCGLPGSWCVQLGRGGSVSPDGLFYDTTNAPTSGQLGDDSADPAAHSSG